MHGTRVQGRPPVGDQRARCLLGRHRRLPSGAYSLLAGFVEPGESLEDAVAREVWEETGVRVSDVRYQASQPWPFPFSMMVGFRAVAETEDIVLDADELEDARWFTAAQISEFGECSFDRSEINWGVCHEQQTSIVTTPPRIEARKASKGSAKGYAPS